MSVKSGPSQDAGGTRFVKGDEKDLLNLQKFARFAKCNFKMTIVQPGLSKAKISADIIQLLGSTENYLIKTSNASLRVKVRAFFDQISEGYDVNSSRLIGPYRCSHFLHSTVRQN